MAMSFRQFMHTHATHRRMHRRTHGRTHAHTLFLSEVGHSRCQMLVMAMPSTATVIGPMARKKPRYLQHKEKGHCISGRHIELLLRLQSTNLRR